MAHEIFTLTRRDNLNEDQRKRAESLNERIELCIGHGLKAQVELLSKEKVTIERGGLITSPPLSEDEITIWRAWLPTVYTSDETRGGVSLGRYSFDRVPLLVLKIWREHERKATFESYEIWTPESIEYPDPVLVGKLGNNTYLLARWGESDASLVSFDDIKRRLARRGGKSPGVSGGDEFVGMVMFAVLLSILFGLVFMLLWVAFVAITGVKPPHPSPEYALSAGFALLITVFFFLSRLNRNMNPVMQAIKRHNSK